MCVRSRKSSCREEAKEARSLKEPVTFQLICSQFSRDIKIYMFNHKSVFYGANLCLTLRHFSQSGPNLEEYTMNFELRGLRLFNCARRKDYVRMIFLCKSFGGVLTALNELFYHVTTDIF